MSQFILILIHHEDPSHGWFEVSASMIDRLGILGAISEYSYYSHDKQQYFLEEDCDAEILIRALKSAGIDYAVRSKRHARVAPCTRLARVGQV